MNVEEDDETEGYRYEEDGIDGAVYKPPALFLIATQSTRVGKGTVLVERKLYLSNNKV